MALSTKLAALDAHQRRARRSRAQKTRRDPLAASAVNGAVTRITEADRLHPSMSASEAVDHEIRAAFAAHPSGEDMRRVLDVCRIMRRTVPHAAAHLTDDHLRHLWRTRGEQ